MDLKADATFFRSFLAYEQGLEVELVRARDVPVLPLVSAEPVI